MIKTGLQGILLHKTIHQDRHLMVHLLTRQGKRLSALFYGGQGGGKKLKVSGLEWGHLIDAQLSLTRTNSELAHCREWTVPWQHEQIRHHHQAFSLMCFMLELVRALAPEDDLGDEHREVDQSSQGLFRVLSNALHRLDKKVKMGEVHIHGEWVLFLGKLLIEQGVFPDRGQCILSGEPLQAGQRLSLVSSLGGFARIELLKSAQEQQMLGEAGTQLWQVLREIAQARYEESIPGLESMGRSHAQALCQYLLYQVQIEPHKIKSLAMLN